MKHCDFSFAGQRWPGIALCLLLLFGCATTPKVNWASRVGVYTFDQAVLDYGPPDRQTKLQDGTVVAEWITARGFAYGFVDPYYGYGIRGGYYGPVTYTQTRIPDYILRLVFAPNGRLSAWKNVVR
jgi:hypothetical protein